jgi:hypothetical protein
VNDTGHLVSDLMTRLNSGTWGGDRRRGKILSVDLTQDAGPLFSISAFSG